MRLPSDATLIIIGVQEAMDDPKLGQRNNPEAEDAIAAEALTHRVSDDQRLKLEGVLESDYYAKQTNSGAPIKFIGIVVAIIMAVGSSFAAKPVCL